MFRAGLFGLPSERDREILSQLEIRTIFDLRSQSECRRHPNGWGQACGGEIISVSIDSDLRAKNKALLYCINLEAGVEGAFEFMKRVYEDFPRSFTQVLPDIFNNIAQKSDLPVLIHCTAGKDSTGFACALLMHALGVDKEIIMLEFNRTSEFIQHESLAVSLGELLAADIGFTLDKAVLRRLCNVEREFLEEAFKSVRVQFGSLDFYLEQIGGLTPQNSAVTRTFLGLMFCLAAEGR